MSDARLCPRCGEANPARARFCLACGAELAGPAEPRRQVRKTVTILFSDVTGSTELGERLDAEALRRVMASYFDEMRAVLERHGGTVEKFIGDAIMAVFGIPVAHEDDALRAVRAAVEMRAALAELNDDLERRHAVRLRVRTGINTGEIVAGEAGAGEQLVTGDPVNVAARLEQAAGPDEILLGQPKPTDFLLLQARAHEALAEVEQGRGRHPEASTALGDAARVRAAIASLGADSEPPGG